MIYILLPAYNEASNILPLLDALAGEAQAWQAKNPGEDNPEWAVHAVVIDDGSTDATGEMARRFSGPIQLTVLEHSTNQGLAAALRTGIDFVLQTGSSGDWVVTLDADRTHHPRYVFRLVEKLRTGRDIVVASRYAPGGREYGVPLWRKWLSHGARFTYRMFFPSVPLQDFSCGYRGFSWDLLRKTVEQWGSRLFEAPGFACTGELMLKMLGHTAPARVTEIPFELHYEAKGGKSKMPAFQTILGTLELLFRARRWLKNFHSG
ncbi:MAG: glycosyltransferase family 2 protein [Candidatus Omnitrophica bacterium]|nr:glycosyltransferase family 2 protein [Candidatus Omnitrophota bacterium]HPP03013.1 glycosyltransferase family 2 protein [bacterium]HXK94467.1 glycosyltransferase family 2 protein [bacterium]